MRDLWKTLFVYNDIFIRHIENVIDANDIKSKCKKSNELLGSNLKVDTHVLLNLSHLRP